MQIDCDFALPTMNQIRVEIRLYMYYKLLTGLFMGGDSLTHLSGHVIIADTSLVVSVLAFVRGRSREGNFFMLRFQLGVNP